MELNLAGRSLEGIRGTADSLESRLAAELSEHLGRLKITGGTHVEGARVVQWEFVRRENSVSTVEIRLLEKSGEIPSAVESWRSPRRVNPVKNFG